MENRCRLICAWMLLLLNGYRLLASFEQINNAKLSALTEQRLGRTVLDSADYSNQEKKLWLRHHPEEKDSEQARQFIADITVSKRKKVGRIFSMLFNYR